MGEGIHDQRRVSHRADHVLHAKTAQGIALDAPAQLTEFTIRDPYLRHWLTEDKIAETTVEFNYDVSYVDSLTAPIAMEATNVPIPIPDVAAPPAANYGWAGANLLYGTPSQVGTMPQLVSDFISNRGESSIGDYFGGKGWPDYFNPNGILNIPSGANLFANSPLNGQKSSYFTYGPDNLWMLSSGGTTAVDVQAGGMIASATSVKLYFDRDSQAGLRDQVFNTFQGWKDDKLTFLGKTSTGVDLGSVTGFVKDDSDPNLLAIVVTVTGPVKATGTRASSSTGR